ncbi:predicted protein [Naegleria gruberi]|uniref:Predicted protein n=1 Tax=Naegleria gruberi TaxID=5762 RepID=D2VYG6_NAEGR|nr:uncharacterized protein NAEGRDRAFT_74113 [Naegleria gruberi]EFC38055.1 predicted protein [Naegleria gruberi]|eukprot:XP_002670799.1 predicted protein [Naegleria gruberi strain NEG-M]
MTLTHTNQPSYGATQYGQQPQYMPPQGYPQQPQYAQQPQMGYQQPMMAQTTVISTPSNLQQYPNGGPVMETIIDTRISSGTFLSLNLSPQLLSNTLGAYGFPNAANAPADIENNIIRPINNLFTQFYNKSSNYDTYYMISFIILMILIILTAGLGVVFIFIIFVFPYLKNRHISSFNETTQIQVRNLLQKENQNKYMPHGLEWVILYEVKPGTSSLFTGFTCMQEASLKLIRVSRQVPTVTTTVTQQQDTLVMN